ncbi:MAG TPA: hypothetical protein VM261_24500 [Kofleriaceae bacterium]|nr:hypothetical protein [Kofleriaceae bacterium]
MRLRALAFVIVAVVVGCSRPSSKDCEEALRNWFTLVYWEKAEAEIAAAPPEQREAMRAEKVKEKDRQLTGGLTLAINQCRGSRDKDGVKCMKDAKTATQARKCRAPKDQ